MLNIRATLTNLRTNQSYTVNHIPVELAKLQIKGKLILNFLTNRTEKQSAG